jgi:hypothetical protein
LSNLKKRITFNEFNELKELKEGAMNILEKAKENRRVFLESYRKRVEELSLGCQIPLTVNGKK